MTSLQLIADLVGSPEVGEGIPNRAINDAIKLGVVIAYADSRDCLNFRGAIHDKVKAYDGFNHTSELEEDMQVDTFQFLQGKEFWLMADPEDAGDGRSWGIKTKAGQQREVFHIFEDGEIFSQGVIMYKDIE